MTNIAKERIGAIDGFLLPAVFHVSFVGATLCRACKGGKRVPKVEYGSLTRLYPTPPHQRSY